MGSANRVDLAIATCKNDPKPPVAELGTCTPSDPAQPFAGCASRAGGALGPRDAQLVRAPLDELAGGLAHDGVNPGESAAITRWMTWSESQLPYDVDVTVDDSEFIEP